MRPGLRVIRAPQIACSLFVVVLAGGCYCSHELEGTDAGARELDVPRGEDLDGAIHAGPDGRPHPRDAGPRGGGYWTLEPREAQVSFPHELGCSQQEGGSLAIRATAAIGSECEHAGPVEVQERADGTLVVHAGVWVEHRPSPEECRGIADLMDRTVLVPARAGLVRVEAALGSSSAQVMVQPAAGGDCVGGGDRGEACMRDCDCVGGLRCVPDLGDFVECFGGRCGDPCNTLGSAVAPVYPRHLDCPETFACVSSSGASSTCERTPDLCTSDADCDEGLACPVADLMDCRWEIVLSAAVRHACSGDADCGPGTHCVEHGDGRRACEVPCFTTEMRCPPMHACDADAGWVCEWLGE